jgi:glucose-1-phosphate cytidylyltransferase|tara:strand:+ start:9191 stop:9880 length:690 start_codon:yes stop_codon:yes gene_type:complete
MKVVILAGGLGSRLSEYTKILPKPMVKILKVPIIVRIIKYYNKFGYNDFIIASGYKSKIIENYFKKNLRSLKIKVINTGKKTMTGGRIKRLEKVLNEKRFLLTYGDGLCNVDIKKLVKLHIKNKNIVTLTAVRPPARFGGIKISGPKVKYFKEKSSLDEGWINGGFFVMEPEIIKFIKNDSTILERYPLEKICKLKKLGAYKHYKSWQCMDTVRDKKNLELLIKKNIFS